MPYRSSIGSIALAAALTAAIAGASAFDETKYPDWKGQWGRVGSAQFDPSKPRGLGQQAPLTAEYQAIFEAWLADPEANAHRMNPTIICIPTGMPRAMILYDPMEIVVTPETTYVLFDYMSQRRRIFTDGRGWPEKVERTFAGYSIGKWEDVDGDGVYDLLAVETRGLKGPRTFDGSGIPLHTDNQTVVKERIYLDKAKPDILHDEITTIDNALTRPWTIKRSYQRERKPIWFEYHCGEDNHFVVIRNENYFVSGDGYLMPTRKGQPAPNLRHFDEARK